MFALRCSSTICANTCFIGFVQIYFPAKRKEILSNELKRLRERRNVVDSSLSTGAPVVGKLMITGVRLPLKPEFIAKSGTLTGVFTSPTEKLAIVDNLLLRDVLFDMRFVRCRHPCISSQ